MVNGIEHVAVVSKDTAALKDWYMEMYGGRVVYDNGKGTYFLQFADGSMIEFVIDDEIAYDYFGGTNGLVSNGNFNNYEYFKGKITDVEAVSDERLEEGVTYDTVVTETVKDTEDSAVRTILKGGY